NFAFESSKGIGYHPHSHRIAYVSSRLLRARRDAEALSQRLIRVAEDEIRDTITNIRNSATLSRFGAFSHTALLPLVFSAVVSRATTWDELLPITLQLRQSGA